jgi:DNA modification methylase
MYTNGTIADGEKIIDFFINKVFNQDCLEILQQLPSDSVDLILQDPPYNQTALDFEWDIFEKIDQFWEQWLRVVKDNGAIVSHPPINWRACATRRARLAC